MKKITIALLLSLYGLVCQAQDFVVDGIYYGFVGDGTSVYVDIAPGSNAYKGDVVIPENVTYNDITYSVSSIGDGAFRGCYKLTSVTIGNSVTRIGEKAFADCVGYIIDRKGNMTAIGLTSVSIGNSVTSIGDGAFLGCVLLTSITIPNSVTSIGEQAFLYCDGLTSVTIPNSVTTIGNGAFCGCDGLASVTIPNSVTSIGEKAFAYCVSLKNVVVGKNVAEIGRVAFIDCRNIRSMISLNPNPPTCDNGVFEAMRTELVSLTVPQGSVSLYEKAYGWMEFWNITGKDLSGVEETLADDINTPAEYYDLSGVRVLNPEKGVYIKRKGNKTTKVVL